ncbi:hypothetical protein FBUS_10056 [Fasciolopsis buskii]|uniref:Uncharacterized protein n=1 Tax=Fasciolopsis buskii TaxID=27845 RepID=A0A8E0RLV4_9TREM|nr:hypothetical protein FBUS_10056 [Fasciolopsis buski]
MSLYFDYNSTTPLATEVIEAIQTSMEDHWENPSSQYSERGDWDGARKQLARSRSIIAHMIRSHQDGEN